MLLSEVVNPDTPKLVALTQFLTDRATDTGAKKKISIETFLSMAHNMGINISADQLKTMATKPPLDNVIVNVTDSDVIFQGAGEGTQISDKMTVSQAEKTVEKMAKRAADQ